MAAMAPDRLGWPALTEATGRCVGNIDHAAIGGGVQDAQARRSREPANSPKAWRTRPELGAGVDDGVDIYHRNFIPGSTIFS